MFVYLNFAPKSRLQLILIGFVLVLLLLLVAWLVAPGFGDESVVTWLLERSTVAATEEDTQIKGVRRYTFHGDLDPILSRNPYPVSRFFRPNTDNVVEFTDPAFRWLTQLLDPILESTGWNFVPRDVTDENPTALLQATGLQASIDSLQIGSQLWVFPNETLLIESVEPTSLEHLALQFTTTGINLLYYD